MNRAADNETLIAGERRGVGRLVPGVLGQLRGTPTVSILTNASSMVGTTAITSILGFAYWWVAARRFTPQEVGLASASISAMLLLGTLGVLGFGTLLIGELPRQRERAFSIVLAALTLAGVAGAALGALFAVGAARLSSEFGPLGATPGAVALFAGGVGLTSATIVLDQALIGLLRGGRQFWRNAIFAGSKLAALLALVWWLADRDALAIFATWAAGNLLSLAWIAALTASRRRHWRTYLPRWGQLWTFRRAALGHHLLNLALQGTSFVMPLIVTALLSATANAYFYAAWTLASFVFAGPMALAIALYAVGSHTPTLVAQRLRFTFGLACLGGLAANGVLLVAANFMLRLFGAGYAENAATTLQILGLAVFPIIVKDHYVTIRRIRGDVRGAAALVGLGGLLELAFAAGGATIGGIEGLAVGLLLGLCVEASFMAPAVWRAARPEGNRGLPAPADGLHPL